MLDLAMEIYSLASRVPQTMVKKEEGGKRVEGQGS
jgi:hypothetical protein